MIRVLAPGPLTTVQDQGRTGYAHLGVGRAGAADAWSLASANRLVGNDAGAAGLEVTLGGLVVQLTTAATVALTGAPGPATIDQFVAVTRPAGTIIRVGAAVTGLRRYLAVRGGIDVDPVLGSRSTDTLSGLGPAPLRAGDELGIGAQPAGPISGVTLPGAVSARPLRIVAGPREDWFRPGALAELTAGRWTVGADSDRIGVRLTGPPLVRIRTEELPSEATLPGALQVPPSGQPILLGPDAPVTGGYPVIAVVHSADRHRAGQLRPGEVVRFRLG